MLLDWMRKGCPYIISLLLVTMTQGLPFDVLFLGSLPAIMSNVYGCSANTQPDQLVMQHS